MQVNGIDSGQSDMSCLCGDAFSHALLLRGLLKCCLVSGSGPRELQSILWIAGPHFGPTSIQIRTSGGALLKSSHGVHGL